MWLQLFSQQVSNGLEEKFLNIATATMTKSCDIFQKSLQKCSEEIRLPINKPATTHVQFFIAFDEAHDLVRRNTLTVHTRAAYTNLGTVLSWMTELPLFVLF